MNDVPFHVWQAHIASDITAVVDLTETTQSSLRFAQPIISAALMQQEFLPTSLLMLCARAIGFADEMLPKFHAFAGAMELINASLLAHVNLPDTGQSARSLPLLSLGPAAGVLLGDCLYTRAFGMIARAGHAKGVAEMAMVTEQMVTAGMLERFPPPGGEESSTRAPVSQLAVVWGASCSLAALLAGSTPARYSLLREFGVRCATFRQLVSNPVHDDPTVRKSKPISLGSVFEFSNGAFRLLLQALPASVFRDDLELFVAHTAMPM